MKEWFKRFFHHHEWRILDEYVKTVSGRQVGTRYILQCGICGCIKKKDIE